MEYRLYKLARKSLNTTRRCDIGAGISSVCFCRYYNEVYSVEFGKPLVTLAMISMLHLRTENQISLEALNNLFRKRASVSGNIKSFSA